MLALDGRPMNQYPKTDPLVQQIDSAIKEIKKRRKWKLVPHDSRRRKNAAGVPDSIIEYNAGVSPMTTGKYLLGGMEHDITYYSTITNVEGVQVFLPKRIRFQEVLPLDPATQADLIFYMTCVSPYCAPFAPIQRFQYIKDNVMPHYKVEDLVGEAQIQNETKRDIAKVNLLLWDDEMGIEDETLKNIAISYGFPTAPTLDIELLKNRLSDSLLRNVNGKYDITRIRAFLNDAKDDGLLKLRNVVRISIEKKFVVKDKTGKGSSAWYYTSIYGEKDAHIMSLMKGSDPETSLVQYLVTKPKARNSFETHYKSRLKDGSLENLKPKPIPVEEV